MDHNFLENDSPEEELEEDKLVKLEICILADSGFFLNSLDQGGVKSTVSWVFEDLRFKMSEG